MNATTVHNHAFLNRCPAFRERGLRPVAAYWSHYTLWEGIHSPQMNADELEAGR
jgi:hypothetical protein